MSGAICRRRMEQNRTQRTCLRYVASMHSRCQAVIRHSRKDRKKERKTERKKKEGMSE